MPHPSKTYKLQRTTLFAAMLSAIAAPCIAQASSPAESSLQNDWRFKLTPSYYQTSQQTGATDVNLRANKDQHALWVGQYEQPQTFHQTRIGYEYVHDTDWGQIVPSLQGASGGFLGGSLNTQWGQSTYLIAGLGRTNLRPYYNLNFDPNDAITLGMGAWVTDAQQWALWQTQDDRLHTGQQVRHLLWRYHMPNGERLTLDAASKKGRSDPTSAVVKGNSLSATWDWARYFVRLARDQKVNFSDNDQTRLSVGWHY